MIGWIVCFGLGYMVAVNRPFLRDAADRFFAWLDNL